MTQQHGRKYEHTLVNTLTMVTPDEVWATTVGYSGNAKTDACDVIVSVDPHLCTRFEDGLYCIEAKKRRAESGKRFSAFSGSADDESGLEEIERFIDGTPDWGQSIVALKVNRRKLFVLDAKRLLRILRGEESPEGQYTVLQPRLTKSDNVSMVKPTTDEWPSATKAKADEYVLAEQLGPPTL